MWDPPGSGMEPVSPALANRFLTTEPPVCVCVCVLVTHLCPTVCDPVDCSPPGFSVYGILQARILEWTAIPFSKCKPAAAKSLQLHLTLCDPIDGSPPGSSVPGILQTRTLEWVAISFSTREALYLCCLFVCF